MFTTFRDHTVTMQNKIRLRIDLWDVTNCQNVKSQHRTYKCQGTLKQA